MQTCELHAPRLYVEPSLAAGARLSCTPDQVNYLLNVLRLKPDSEILIFNGRDGEWRASIVAAGKRRCELLCTEQTRAQQTGPDIHYIFAPLKHARLDYVVQKATEMGVARLQPVLTRRTIAARVNLSRMRANAVEAAEQCNILWVPAVAEPLRLGALLEAWEGERRLVFCDEGAEVASPLAALDAVGPGPLAVLIGPEGGFDSDERALLRKMAFAHPISLGPRIMRADTAAVAALALVNAALGDWR